MDIKLECLENLTDLLKRFGRAVEGEVSLRPREDNASAQERQTHLSRPTLSKGYSPSRPSHETSIVLPVEEKSVVLSVEGESIVFFAHEKSVVFSVQGKSIVLSVQGRSILPHSGRLEGCPNA